MRCYDDCHSLPQHPPASKLHEPTDLPAGSLPLLPKVLDAADRFQVAPSGDTMQRLVAEHGIEPIFE